jgi:hypothetical protein
VLALPVRRDRIDRDEVRERSTIMLDPEIRNRVEIELLKKGKRRGFSQLVNHLLREWLESGAPVEYLQ